MVLQQFSQANWIVRPETEADHEAVRIVLHEAFGRSAEADLVDSLRSAADVIQELTLVVLEHGQVVGHVLYSPILIAEAAGVALAPLAVKPSYQRRGFGSLLVETSLAISAERSDEPIVVVGHPEYYTRFGFERADQYGIHAPFEMPTEAFMVWFPAGKHRQVRGTVQYAPAFSLH